MELTIWFLIIGVLLVLMALTGSIVQRLPLTAGLVYLAVGFVLGPNGFGLIQLNPVADPDILELLTEIAVILSLFSAGLKLRLSWRDRSWLPAVRLATGAMIITIGLTAAAGVLWLGLPLGAAILLGAILAPTDPVLASEVSIEEPGDDDRVRFSLTGEAGLNDGAAFPFVMLGLGLLGLHQLGDNGWRWVTIDLIWAVLGGLAIGAVLGTLVGRLILYLRRQHQEAVGLDEFLALGLIALAYGGALALHTYGFLAVFAAGLALRRVEHKEHGEVSPPRVSLAAQDTAADELATHPDSAPAYMARATLVFTQQIERIGTVLLMVVVGGLLTRYFLPSAALWFVPLLLLVIRPAAAWIGLLGTPLTGPQRGIVAWFGLRGLGSIYYLTYAIAHGLPEPYASQLTGLTLTVVAVSVIVHGITVTPVMSRYHRMTAARESADRRPA